MSATEKNEFRELSEPEGLARRLFTHVDHLAGLIGPRPSSHLKMFEAAAGYIEREFQNLGDAVEREWYDAGVAAPVSNLVVTRRGTCRPDEVIVLGAHYDTVSTTPGADDNASAVAVLIEVARLLQGRPFQRTVRFVAFACEEPPHFHTMTMGSQYHARQCRVRDEKILGMLCLEMVGYFSTAENSQQVPPAIPKLLRGVIPTRGDFLAAVSNLSSWRLLRAFQTGFRKSSELPLFPIALPENISEIRLSDQSSFWDQGYPALMLTDTSFLRNPHYHEPTDTPETLDYPRMAQVTQGVVGALGRLAKPET
ncbi:MAG: M28 family peptidase [Planctomycetes bacterium]|nr:M28 family peptidase [Planctomycetota bacterium]